MQKHHGVRSRPVVFATIFIAAASVVACALNLLPYLATNDHSQIKKILAKLRVGMTLDDARKVIDQHARGVWMGGGPLHRYWHSCSLWPRGGILLFTDQTQKPPRLLGWRYQDRDSVIEFPKPKIEPPPKPIPLPPDLIARNGPIKVSIARTNVPKLRAGMSEADTVWLLGVNRMGKPYYSKIAKPEMAIAVRYPVEGNRSLVLYWRFVKDKVSLVGWRFDDDDKTIQGPPLTVRPVIDLKRFKQPIGEAQLESVRKNFARLKRGMTQSEVINTLGLYGFAATSEQRDSVSNRGLTTIYHWKPASILILSWWISDSAPRLGTHIFREGVGSYRLSPDSKSIRWPIK